MIKALSPTLNRIRRDIDTAMKSYRLTSHELAELQKTIKASGVVEEIYGSSQEVIENAYLANLYAYHVFEQMLVFAEMAGEAEDTKTAFQMLEKMSDVFYSHMKIPDISDDLISDMFFLHPIAEHLRTLQACQKKLEQVAKSHMFIHDDIMELKAKMERVM